MTYVLQIDWGHGYRSPVIGPFSTLGEANKTASEIRRELRRAGRPYRGRVRCSIIVSPQLALGWVANGVEA